METSKLVHTQNDKSIKNTETNDTPESQEKVDVVPQTSPVKGTSSQKSRPHEEPIQKNNTRSEPVPLPNHSEDSQPEFQETENDSTANSVRDDIIPPLISTAPHIERKLLRDENTKEQ